jgi:glycosyltransferase involved in cell wall biosynthesis
MNRWQRLLIYLKKHAFRARMSPERQAAHRSELETLFKLYNYDPDPGPLIQTAEEESAVRVWDPVSLFPGHLALFPVVLKAFYYPLEAVGRFLEKRRRPPARRPLRVLRMLTRLTQGGVAKVCLQGSLAMPRDRVEFILWPFGLKEKNIRELEAKLEIELIRRKIELSPGSYKFGVLGDIWKVAREIRRWKPDLVHIHEPQFAPAARMAAALAGGVPVVVQLHNDYIARPALVPDTMIAMVKHALRRSHLLACSDTIHSAGARWLGVAPTRIGLAEDGTDDRIEHQAGKELAGELRAAAEGRKVVAMMSHIKPHKRIDDFLAACRALLDRGEPIFVLLMCYGKAKHGLRLKLKFNAWFAPHEGDFFFQVDGPQHLLPIVDVGVSSSSVEGLGLNILEFQIASIPVVCTNIQAHREMVEDEVTGLLYETSDVNRLTEQIARLLADEALRGRLATAGRERAGRRRWADTAAALDAFYETSLRNGPPAG